MGENAVPPLARNNPNGGAHALAARRYIGPAVAVAVDRKGNGLGFGAIEGFAERVPPNAKLAGNEHLFRFPARVYVGQGYSRDAADRTREGRRRKSPAGLPCRQRTR